MEYIDVFDENMRPLGTIPKKEAHRTGAWHRSIHCWIVRKDNEGENFVVFQKRSATKTSFPNKLDISAAGHYQTGERVEDGIREITEELGISVKFSSLKYLGIKFDIYKSDNFFNREFCETFLYRDDRELSEYPIDCDEVTGLVQVRVQDGLDLFSGEIDSITVEGVEFNEHTKKIEHFSTSITKESVIQRIDPYYGKIFMIAKAYFNGEDQLFI